LFCRPSSDRTVDGFSTGQPLPISPVFASIVRDPLESWVMIDAYAAAVIEGND
jgi:hypothetical protein